MAKQDYEVTRPWAGVTLGDIVKLDPEKIHPAIKSNIRPVGKAGKPKADEAEQIVKDARAEAEQIVKDARAEADSIMLNAHSEAEKLKAKK